MRQHEPRVQHPTIGHTGASHALERRAQDCRFDLFENTEGCVAWTRVATHSAGVRALVVIAEPLVVARRRHDRQALAVAEGHDGQLGPIQPLFDQHALTRRAEDFPFEQGFERRLNLLAGVGDPHTFASGQPIGFDDHGQPEFRDRT
jgi:hypothetical protein